MVAVNSLIPESQSGFRKGYSTVTVLTKVLVDIMVAIDKGEMATLILLVFSKAFDTLGRELLLSKLHYYGFAVHIVSMINYSYLSKRCQGLDKLQREYHRLQFWDHYCLYYIQRIWLNK